MSSVISKETIQKFTTSVIKVHIEKPDLKKNILNTKVTLERPDTHKKIVIPNIKVTQLINNIPVGKKPEMKTPVYPGDRETVDLRIIVEVPHVGSKTKEIIMPVKDGSKFLTKSSTCKGVRYKSPLAPRVTLLRI